MSKTQDISLRAHTVVVSPKKTKKGRRNCRGRRPRRNLKKWPKYAVVFDCETRIDTRQGLTFGFYRVLRLDGDTYQLEEEGAFFDDNLATRERDVLERYAATADTEVRTFPPRFPLHPRSKLKTSFLPVCAKRCFDRWLQSSLRSSLAWLAGGRKGRKKRRRRTSGRSCLCSIPTEMKTCTFRNSDRSD